MHDEPATLLSLIERLGGRGDRPAVVQFLPGEGVVRCGYDRLGERVTAIARGLYHAYPGEKRRIALMAPPSIDAVVAALAVIRAGAVLLPIDRQLDEPALRHVLADGEPSVVIAGREERERLNAPATGRRVRIRPVEELDRWRRREGALPVPAPADQAVLFYTSGTTGPPKGVPLTHKNIASQFEAVAVTGLVGEGDRVLLPLPLHHVYPLVIGLFVPLYLGLTVIVPAAVTGPQLVRAAREGEATVMIGVPRLYAVLDEGIARRIGSLGGVAGTGARRAVAIASFLRRRGVRVGGKLLGGVRRGVGPHLRVLASGGSALDPDLFIRLEALGWHIGVGYGLTETSPLLTIGIPGTIRPGSAGRVVKGVKLRIDHSAAPPGMKGWGEIQARGAGVFGGYRNLPQDTAAAFTDDGWFKTGDLGRLGAGGEVFITGRLSSVIVTESGENIQPDEVESAYEQHPFIREIGVFERNRRLAAVVVPEGGGVAESGRTADEAIRDALEERGAKMPSYKRIADVALSREELPRTRLGKIRRHLLPELFERGSGAAVAAPREGGPMAVEEMSSADRGLLADPAAGKVWKMLGRRFADRRLTPDTSPQLDLGVDSLGWLEVSLDIRDATGVEIDEEAIGRIETLRDLLGEVAKRAAAGPAGRGDPFTEPRRYLDASGRRWLEAPGPVNRLLARILYTVNQAVMHTYFRVTVRGTENLYAVEQFVLAPNHVSYLDSFALAAAIPYDLLRRTAWAGGTRPAFANPLNRFVSRLAGAIPIRHALSAGSEMALAVAVIDQGKNLIWYPEGRREPRGELLPFRPGIGLLLRHRPLPVLSVRIRGTGRAMPIGRIVPRPAAIEVSFDRPREVGELMAAAVGEKRGGEERRIVAGLRAVHEELGKA